MKKILVHRSILILSLFVLSGCNFQRNMLYYPSQYLPSQADLVAENIRFWPSGLKDYRGFVSTIPADKAKGTIVVFHGNAGTAADRVYYVQALTRLGYRVLLAEYPGYGGRNGKPGEEVFVNDAKETLRIASEQYGAPVVLLGESLGCGVAAAAAKDPPVKLGGIMLITPWDTLLSVAKDHFPWLPVRLFMRDTYDTIGNLRQYPGRIAIVGAERDDVVPIRHARTLFESLPGDKKMYTIKGAGHNDWPDVVGLAWWKEITDFIEGNER
jgi:uncharacterized protein